MRNLDNAKVIVFGVANQDSIAWAVVEQLILDENANVVAVVQTDKMRQKMERLFENRFSIEFAVCDVTDHNQIEAVYEKYLGPNDPLLGLVHSVGFAPSTCLGHDLGTAPVEDVKLGFEISAASLAYLVELAKPYFSPEYGGGVVTLQYAWDRVSPHYKWMGAFKASLAYIVKDLATEVGPLGVSINSVSAGPQQTLAARGIPGFSDISGPWNDKAPLGWDARNKQRVAEMVVHLLKAEGITGEEVHVDGGMHIMMPI